MTVVVAVEGRANGRLGGCGGRRSLKPGGCRGTLTAACWPRDPHCYWAETPAAVAPAAVLPAELRPTVWLEAVRGRSPRRLRRSSDSRALPGRWTWTPEGSDAEAADEEEGERRRAPDWLLPTPPTSLDGSDGSSSSETRPSLSDEEGGCGAQRKEDGHFDPSFEEDAVDRLLSKTPPHPPLLLPPLTPSDSDEESHRSLLFPSGYHSDHSHITDDDPYWLDDWEPRPTGATGQPFPQFTDIAKLVATHTDLRKGFKQILSPSTGVRHQVAVGPTTGTGVGGANSEIYGFVVYLLTFVALGMPVGFSCLH